MSVHTHPVTVTMHMAPTAMAVRVGMAAGMRIGGRNSRRHAKGEGRNGKDECGNDT
jgi:hypothetical protein